VLYLSFYLYGEIYMAVMLYTHITFYTEVIAGSVYMS